MPNYEHKKTVEMITYLMRLRLLAMRTLRHFDRITFDDAQDSRRRT
jgi:hypothetical protein